MKKLYLSVLFVLSILLPFSTPAISSTFDHIVAFGDSLSDGGFWGAPFTNDKVWIEYLSENLASRQGNTVTLDNRAIGGAQTTGRPIDLDSQIAAYLAGIKPGFNGTDYTQTPATTDFDPTTLFSIWIGGNDSTSFLRSATDAVDSLLGSMGSLNGAGAMNFLIPYLPDVGNTPAIQADEPPPVPGNITQFCNDFNTYLEGQLALLTGINIYTIDVMGIMDGLSEDQLSTMYWDDGFHPSSIGHGMIAAAALNEIAPVPVPATITLLGIGLLGLAGVSRRKS